MAPHVLVDLGTRGRQRLSLQPGIDVVLVRCHLRRRNAFLQLVQLLIEQRVVARVVFALLLA